MSKGIYYQSYIILLGEDNEEVEETYEEYEDDMIDEDSQSATIADENEDLDGDFDMNDTNNNNRDEIMNDDDDDDDLPLRRGVSIDEEVDSLGITVPTHSNASAIIVSSNNNNDVKVDDKVKSKSPEKTMSSNQSDKNNITTLITTNINNNNNNGNNSNSNTTSTVTSPTSSLGSPLSPKEDKENKKQSSFLKLFSRGKKNYHDGKKNGSPNETTSDQGSTNSSTISEDLQHVKDTTAHSTSSSTAVVDPSATVLRVYAGNINVNATYNSVLVYENTNAENLLRLAMDRFHISQIEGNSRGKRSASPYQLNSHSSGVEYYLSVKPMDGDERVLLPQDKPLMIYQSLTAHLTTPMPSLANIKQQIKNVEFGRIGTPTNTSHKRPGAKYGEDSIRFYLHKRIRRVNEQNGQVYVKVSLYQDDNDMNKKRNKNVNNGNNNNNKNNFNSKDGMKKYSSSTSLSSSSKNNKTDGNNHHHLSSSFSMRRKKSTLSASSSTSSLITVQSQIDKLIAVPAIATIAELIDIALEKFHLVQTGAESHHHNQPKYRMTIVINNQGTEKHLNPNSKIVEVLHDDTHPESTAEKRFVLRKINTASTKSNTHSNKETTRSHTPHNKPTPKLNVPKPKTAKAESINRESASSPLLTPIPVMQLDTETEMVLRRLERALLTYNRKPTDGVPPRVQLDPHQPKLAVMRNVNKGIDVYLPHGILRSKPLTANQTQFVLMANDEKNNKDSNWNLVTQRVLSTESTAPSSTSGLCSMEDNNKKNTSSSTNSNNSSLHGIELTSDSDLKELIAFGTQFLESVEQNGALLNKPTSSSLLLEKGTPQTSSSLSSLDELERELHRIIASHTTK
ncbi:unnamed protein product [Cunninghamella echinulata]